MARIASLVCVCAAAAMFAGGLAACGTQHVDVPKKEAALHTGAVLFSQRCSGCHTLAAAATHGSSSNIRTRERTDGPNFNVRCETVTRVLYAIRNGGFSGAIMPQNIVVGSDAGKVARFVARYSGTKAVNPPSPQGGGGRPTSRGSTPNAQAPAGGQCGVSGASR
jgi:mono/diheme cytochrome c family protein